MLRILLLIFCCPLFLTAQLAPDDALLRYGEVYFPEKVFVHTDKSIYAGGETIWAAVYLLDGQTHLPDSTSQVVYLALHDEEGTEVQRSTWYARDGHISADLQLPSTILPGEYQLTAYTNYQRNGPAETMFRKTLRIVGGLKESGGITAQRIPQSPSLPPYSSPSSAYQLRFFPEGGDCIDGLPCRVAIVAEGADGAPLPVQGVVVAEDGERLGSVTTTETGIGTLRYLPQTGKTFRLLIGEEKAAFPIPPALREGMHLSVKNLRDSVRLTVRSNLAEGVAGASLFMHVRGIPLLRRDLTGQYRKASFLLPKAMLPPGVLTVTLFDAYNEPVAERLFFVAPSEGEIMIGIDSVAKPRSPVDVDFTLPVADADSVVSGRLSVSVIPAAAAGGPSGDDIRSWILLNSDLDRPITDAASLLRADSAPARLQKIEDYLLTREWRRFRWSAITQPGQLELSHFLEQGIYLRGRMGKLENRTAARPGKVFLTRLENAYLETTITDEDGNFVFGPYAVFGELPVAIQGRFKAGKRNRFSEEIDLEDNNNVSLEVKELDSPNLPPLPRKAPAAAPAPELTEAVAEYAEISRQTLTVARNFDSLIIDLDVVDVVTKRLDPVKEARRARTQLYGEPDNRIVLEDAIGLNGAQTVLDLLRTVPGLQIAGNGPDASITVRGPSSFLLPTQPLYFLDGMPVTLDVLFALPLDIVEFIDVLKGVAASIYGVNGSSGVILVYTRRGVSLTATKQPGLLNTQILGYQKARQFAVFDASLPANRNRPDYRTTLHWNPNIRTDEQGQATDQLQTSDQAGEFLIIVQGLRGDGRPLVGTQRFRVAEER